MKILYRETNSIVLRFDSFFASRYRISGDPRPARLGVVRFVIRDSVPLSPILLPKGYGGELMSVLDPLSENAKQKKLKYLHKCAGNSELPAALVLRHVQA